ncbi:large-conductance mechanosensitive channel protein MscL [Siccirubricoccus sp. KC 17139]|uniref:Large-conductance mechanosensitive channel n=1 Tax=Siccirubricoccus soli TaxID=2899147 RepID=A0ABT1DAL9_9PROT|nr:large-conductance mechanosensitive channel protein MscL [Siccirubricoccus soli]MCO6418285.1 large-conductance mechanosensitive channel protein MscL [Siccirubricoccus soli]MCP2684420.1 large-conductance mechanosensitive channel protein MscL [Siccirubricoccus soli]
MQSPISLREPAWLREFKAFIMRGSVVDLAVGLVVGAAFTTIVTSFVEDIINPVIGLAIGGVDFSNIFLVLNGERQASLAATRQGGAAVIAIGSFINTIIKFLIVSFAIFWVVKALSKLRLNELGKAPPVETPTEKLLAEIRDELKAQRAPRQG